METIILIASFLSAFITYYLIIKKVGFNKVKFKKALYNIEETEKIIKAQVTTLVRLENENTLKQKILLDMLSNYLKKEYKDTQKDPLIELYSGLIANLPINLLTNNNTLLNSQYKLVKPTYQLKNYFLRGPYEDYVLITNQKEELSKDKKKSSKKT